ncbi:MAG: FkbM family methyltransferase [Clostridia bacterium]|nr:FkbM family methyltransferase [Clostridia bacterium]
MRFQNKKKESIAFNMTDLWDNLKNTPYPIVLYGMGNGADKIIKVLNERGIEFKGIFSSDGFQKPGKTFHGFPVLSLFELEKIFGKMTVLMCFGSNRPEVIENVKRIKQKHLFFAPDVPVYGDILFDKNFYLSKRKEHDDVLDILADGISKKTFENTLKYKLSGNVDFLFDCEVSEIEPYGNFFKLGDNETYLDLGAYRGDTVFDFLKYVNNSYHKIYAVEPDKKTFGKLSRATENVKNITLINCAVSEKTEKGNFVMNGSRGSNISDVGEEIDLICVDDIIGDNEITYIKADVEGAELEFIKGAEKTIKTKKPKMQIACYHRSDDLINIPNAVLNIRDDYKVYMRHFSSLPSWDTVYFFV